MSSPKSLSGRARTPIALDDARESLRRKFHCRLQSERIQLAALATALSQVGDEPSSAFEELRLCAHRMHGAAAVFDYLEVAAAAGSLEQASEVASTAHAGNFDRPVWTALVSLLGLLDHVAPQPSKSSR
jgi:HPt (histidine-containing phosphotransfer) domain-containing protein